MSHPANIGDYDVYRKQLESLRAALVVQPKPNRPRKQEPPTQTQRPSWLGVAEHSGTNIFEPADGTPIPPIFKPQTNPNSQSNPKSQANLHFSADRPPTPTPPTITASAQPITPITPITPIAPITPITPAGLTATVIPPAIPITAHPISAIQIISMWPEKLDACIERLRNSMAPDQQLPEVRHIPGIHGQTIDVDNWQRTGKYKPLDGNTLKRGELGCFAAHRSAWQAMLDNGDEYCLILEDDADFPMHLLPYLQETVETYHPDVFYVSRNPGMARVIKRVSESLVVPGKTWGAFAIVLSKKAAQWLLHHSRRISSAVDIYLSMNPTLRKGLKYLAIDPPPFRWVHSRTSDTQGIW